MSAPESSPLITELHETWMQGLSHVRNKRTQRSFRGTFNSLVPQRPVVHGVWPQPVSRVQERQRSALGQSAPDEFPFLGPRSYRPKPPQWINDPARPHGIFQSTVSLHRVPEPSRRSNSSPILATTSPGAPGVTTNEMPGPADVPPAPDLFGADALMESINSGAIAPIRGAWLVAQHKKAPRQFVLSRRQDLPQEAFFSARHLRRLIVRSSLESLA